MLRFTLESDVCRWTKLRASLLPLTIILEPISESLICGALVSWAVSTLFCWSPLAFFFVHCLVWFLLDYVLLLVVQVRFCISYFDSVRLTTLLPTVEKLKFVYVII